MIVYEERWLMRLLLRRKGSVFPRACIVSAPAALIALTLRIIENFDHAADSPPRLVQLELGHSAIWAACSATLGLIMAFRTRQALGRFWEGTTLLHQMRGEWFDAVSCLMTFSRAARQDKPDEVWEFRHTLVRLMSLMHGSALEEIKDTETESFEVIDIRGLDTDTLQYLQTCKNDDYNFNRVEVLLHMIQVLVTQNHDDGVLKIAPPILSRVYQTLSRGLVNLLNARKITDTQFPFPYAQLIAALLSFYCVFTPCIVAAIVPSSFWAALVSFVPVFALWSLNFIASELEMPFGDDENDLPLSHWQSEMNTSLLMLLHERADSVAHTSSRVNTSFEMMAKGLRESRVRATKKLGNTTKDLSRKSLFDMPELSEREMSRLMSVSSDQSVHNDSRDSSLRETKAQSLEVSVLGFSSPPAGLAAATPAVIGALGSAPLELPPAAEKSSLDMAVEPRLSTAEKSSLDMAVEKSFEAMEGKYMYLSSIEEVDKKLERWVHAADTQVRELNRNTEALAILASSVPKMYSSSPGQEHSPLEWGHQFHQRGSSSSTVRDQLLLPIDGVDGGPPPGEAGTAQRRVGSRSQPARRSSSKLLDTGQQQHLLASCGGLTCSAPR